MKISIRNISNTDFPFLKKVYRSTREKEMELFNWSEEQKSNFIDFQFNAQHSHYINSFKGADFLIIKLNRTDIGRLYIWRTESQMRVIDISLLEKYRAKSIGTKILTGLIKESKKSGKKMNLHVEHNNPALKLYKRLGFEIREDTGTYYFMERIPESNS